MLGNHTGELSCGLATGSLEAGVAVAHPAFGVPAKVNPELPSVRLARHLPQAPGHIASLYPRRPNTLLGFLLGYGKRL